MKCAVASAPGRVCLAGEDIDWISGPSILCAIDIRTVVKVTALENSDNTVEISSKGSITSSFRISLDDIGQYNGHALDYVNAAIKILRDEGAKISPVKIEITSHLPASAGLSSSAAVTVSAIKALSEFFCMRYDNKDIAHLAYLVEKNELGRGVGQMDLYSCSYGGILYLNSSTIPPSEMKSFDLPVDVKLAIVDTLLPRSTAEVIRMKRLRLTERETGILNYIDTTEKLIQNMYDEFCSPRIDLARIGSLITDCHKTLDHDMRVSTQLINECVRICLEKGAYGAKLTGTGMGGCMFALFPESIESELKRAFENMPIQLYITTIASDGVLLFKKE